MARNDGKAWEKKVAEIFENIGYAETTIVSKNKRKFNSIGVKKFCFEPINPDMQVDVFVRVNETQWVLIECRDRRNSTIKKWLHEIKGRCATRQSQIYKEHKKFHPHVFGVAATSLKDIDEKIQEVASDAGVSLWHHGIIDYLRSITKGAKDRVEDMVLYRCGIKKDNYSPIDLQVQKWPQDKGQLQWFVGFVSPAQIGHAAFVYQRGQGFGENAYQRFLKPKRISEIAEFVRKGNVFPNSIVIALPPGTRIPKGQNTDVFTLSMPGDPNTLKIIDGQHRFFGALASGTDPKLLCTFVKAEDLEQAIMFAKVNGKQVSVTSSQLIALFGIPRFAAKIAAGVNEEDQKKIDLEESVYRTLERLNKVKPLLDKINFYPGRSSCEQIPFKTIYDNILLISRIENSGFCSLMGSPKEKGRIFGDRLANFFLIIQDLIGSKNFTDKNVWFQPTILSAIIRTYPICRQENISRELDDRWLRKKRLIWKGWRPDPNQYRGSGNIKIFARDLCKRLGIDSNIYNAILK